MSRLGTEVVFGVKVADRPPRRLTPAHGLRRGIIGRIIRDTIFSLIGGLGPWCRAWPGGVPRDEGGVISPVSQRFDAVRRGHVLSSSTLEHSRHITGWSRTFIICSVCPGHDVARTEYGPWTRRAPEECGVAFVGLGIQGQMAKIPKDTERTPPIFG